MGKEPEGVAVQSLSRSSPKDKREFPISTVCFIRGGKTIKALWSRYWFTIFLIKKEGMGQM